MLMCFIIVNTEMQWWLLMKNKYPKTSTADKLNLNVPDTHYSIILLTNNETLNIKNHSSTVNQMLHVNAGITWLNKPGLSVYQT